MSSRCNHCGLMIVDEAEKCPLCHGVLEKAKPEVEGERTYPDIFQKNKKITFIFRIILLAAIVASAISVAVNISQQPCIWWSVIVCAGAIYTVWMLYLMTKDDTGYRARIFLGVIGGVALVILVDCVMGFTGWSMDYVLPGAMILVDVALILLMFINKRNWQSYIIFQIVMILLGFVPLILLYFDIVQHPFLSEITLGLSIVMFLGSVILGGKTARTELKRRFHI